MKSLQASVLLAQLCLYLGYVICQVSNSDACVLLRDCPSAWSLSQSDIQRRICGYEDDRYIKVWCKVTCKTPDNDEGVCTPVEKCKPFNDVFRNSDPNNFTIRNYLRQFVCGSVSSARNHYVCCPNKPLPITVTTPPTTVTPIPVRPFENLQCGIATDQFKVVGGTYANLGEHPWAAMLQYNRRGKISVLCGGTLIGSRYVLTAAHCADERAGKLLNVILGDHNTSSPVDCYGNTCAPAPKIIRIEKVIQHSGWVSGIPQFYDDIALLRLEQNVEFSEFVRPICLPTPKYTPTYSTKLIVVGWGRADDGKGSDVKRVATLFRQQSENCLNTIPLPLRNQQLCVGGGTADSCKGDSGGPLMTSIENNAGVSVWYLTGVVSLGYDNPCGTINKPGIYTSVSHYLNWIQKNMY